MLHFLNTVFHLPASSRGFILHDRTNRPSFPNPFTENREALGCEAPIDDINDHDFRARRAQSQATKVYRVERCGTERADNYPNW